MMNMLKSKMLKSYRVIVFDLDNTLYDENEYLFAAYADIGCYVARKIGGKAFEYETFLIHTFQKEGRYNLFDKFICNFCLTGIITKEELLNILRSNDKTLHVYENLKMLLSDLLLIEQHRVYILTNGNVLQQRNKIANLDIPDLLLNIRVIYADDYIPKPSPFCLNEIIRNEEINTKDIVFIGDSKIDEEAAKAAKIDYINIYDYRI